MKTIAYISLIILLMTILTACPKDHENAKIQVRNSITNTTMQSIYWGDLYIGSSLMPGQTSSEVSIGYESEYMDQVNTISFNISTNGKEVYLTTKENFGIQEGAELQITIDNDTEVENILN